MPKTNAINTEIRYIFLSGNVTVLNDSYKYRVSLPLFYLVNGRILVLDLRCVIPTVLTFRRLTSSIVNVPHR